MVARKWRGISSNGCCHPPLSECARNVGAIRKTVLGQWASHYEAVLLVTAGDSWASSSWIRTFHPSAYDVDQLFNGAQQGGLAIPQPCFQGVDQPSRFPGRVPCSPPPGCPCHIPGTPLPALSTDRPKAVMGLSIGDWPAILPPFPARPHQWSDSVWERWNCRTGHWRTTSQGWTFQDWTMTDECVGS